MENNKRGGGGGGGNQTPQLNVERANGEITAKTVRYVVHNYVLSVNITS